MYSHSGNWAWEYYPPPYDFLAPCDSARMPAPILPRRGFGALPARPSVPASARPRVPSFIVPGAQVSADVRGYRGASALLDRLSPGMPRLAAAGVSGLGGCGCGCGGHCAKPSGLGLFDSGLDFSQWGIPEWGVAAVGGYLAISLVLDMLAAGRGVKKYKARVSKRRAIRQKYQKELAAA